LDEGHGPRTTEDEQQLRTTDNHFERETLNAKR
jgi:hypothetical protein